jgi:hypothetical protein
MTESSFRTAGTGWGVVFESQVRCGIGGRKRVYLKRLEISFRTKSCPWLNRLRGRISYIGIEALLPGPVPTVRAQENLSVRGQGFAQGDKLLR